jgi:hypothetical protein
MKPKRYKPEFAVQAWVEAESRRFRFPDLDTIAPGQIFGEGGGAPRLVVAPSDSSDQSKSRADELLTGVGDDQALQGIVDQFGNDGGRLLLTEGNINFTDEGLWTISGPTRVEGMGKGSTIINGDSQSALVLPGDFGTLEHVGVFNSSSNAGARAAEIVGSNARVTDCILDCVGAVAIELDGDESTIDHNILSSGGILIGGAYNQVKANLVFANGHGINVSGAVDCQVCANIVDASSLPASNTFDGLLIDGDRNVVALNTVIPAGAGNTTRYGLNVNSGNDNAVFANYLGDSSDYGTADSVDNATATQTTPAAGAIGGQWAF